MISLEEARATQFATSTRSELRKYAEELGLEPQDNANSATLKKMVCAALGIALGSAAAAPSGAVNVTIAGGSDKIFPSYNLLPGGMWGGRRHRVSLPRPEGSKLAQSESFEWGGKAPYYVPYDEVTDVPEPIYQIIVGNRRRRTVPRETKMPGGGVELTTGWEFDDVPLRYYGVDPVTANRAGSLMEWYQSRGTAFFKALTLRQMHQLCQRIEQPTERRIQGGPAVAFTEDELRGNLLQFFFGYADAESEPNDKIEA